MSTKLELPPTSSWGSRDLHPLTQTFEFDLRPLVQVQWLYNLSTTLKGGIFVVIIFLIGTVAQFWALGNLEPGTWKIVTAFLAGVLFNFIGLFVVVCSYSRQYVWWILQSFEFIYLSIQIILFNVIDARERVTHLHWGWTLSLIPNTLLTCVALFCMDASHLPRVFKGVLMMFGSVVYLGLALSLLFVNETSQQEIDFKLFKTTLGIVAQTCCINLSLFCARFAFETLWFKYDVVILKYAAARNDWKPTTSSPAPAATSTRRTAPTDRSTAANSVKFDVNMGRRELVAAVLEQQKQLDAMNRKLAEVQSFYLDNALGSSTASRKYSRKNSTEERTSSASSNEPLGNHAAVVVEPTSDD